ncbi:unnamed protein product [Psylliodes chrysocephalus]|uniref:C-type lectin domain-containing protein n=1 Tax=Psylliodes chrysocephalus TaxID=3402493 RepID=A0A9P0CBQ9_9CUCU|nr:unnamed protein product [Psylliodes chrysocephala]
MSQMMSSNLILIGVICSMFMVIVHPEEYLSPVLPARKTVNWFNYLGKVYYVDSIFQTNFYSAMQFCRQQGMQLLSINNDEENQRIGNFIKDKGFTFNRFWTSATNLADKKKWVWLSTGNQVTFFKWYPGEPNKALNDSENCIEAGWFGTAGFTWNDLNCSRTDKYFICEATTDCHNLHCSMKMQFKEANQTQAIDIIKYWLVKPKKEFVIKIRIIMNF